MTELSTVPAFPATRAPGCPFEPPAEFAPMRDQEAITQASCPAGIDAWVVSRYEDVRALLSAPGVSSRKAPSAHVMPDADLDRPVMSGNVLQLDGKEHARLRRMLTAEFTVRRMEALRPYIQRIVDEHVDALLAGPKPVDFYEHFALPIPSLVICELLGVPYEDREMIHARSATLMAVDGNPEVMYATHGELRDYMGTLFTGKLADPGDDLISRMIQRSRESGDPVSEDEMVELSITLLIAGHETTANMIALSTAVLAQHPDKLQALRDTPGLAPSAVEEMLRYLSVVQFGLLRYATDDLDIGGRTVKAGDWVVAALNSGNRDERVYDRPDAIDLERKAKTHLAFGFGIHQCIGQQLARIELREVYARLFGRVPGLRLAVSPDRISFKDNTLVYGVHELPVTWED
ncbi:cytochrome P450 [Kibdelosporangium phytohabitans]|uniref:Cytochrome n=1 Tax=Kibdelosporangium phytohabitans TaxID=860235 RepID=A0A0N9IAQ9_9PSEU|nr:cytochrome P450 [Kibdelosporangium phytohabitans]ALG11579.1 cytochrome [Kibdelosporangium phytohabitans]MBE1462947.1 cytochrome P450 [Kibdelosporangium phytohabitans]